MPAAIAIACTLGIIALVIGLSVWADKRRLKALTAMAEGLGWTYDPKAVGFVPGSGAFALFDIGRARRSSNLLRGTFGGRDVEVFDYSYTTGGGKNQHTSLQTVVHIEDPALSLPWFSVRPENVMHKMMGAFGYQDIDLPENPEFSKRFLLRGSDEAAIRERFVDALPDILDANRGIGVDGGGGHLYVFLPGRRPKVDAFPEWLTQADEVIRAFYDTAPSAYAAPPPRLADAGADLSFDTGEGSETEGTPPQPLPPLPSASF